MIRASIFGILAAVPCVAFAQTLPNIEGDYEGRGEGSLSMRTLLLDFDKHVIAASVAVGAPGCGGGFVGIGELKGNVLALRPYTKEEGAESCVITVTFDKTGKTATISEEGCQYYHGAACAFEGKLAKKR